MGSNGGGSALGRVGRWVLSVGVVIGAVAVAAGCTSDPEPGPTTTAVATVAPATEPMVPDLLTGNAPLSIAEVNGQRQYDAAVDLLRAQQALHRALMEPVNPDDPEFVSRFTGDALERERARIISNRDQHLAVDAPSIFELRVESMADNDDGSITATTCYTMKVRFYRSDTGETLEDALASQWWRYLLVQGSDTWQTAREEYLGDAVSGGECPSR